MGQILELKGFCDARECVIFGICCNIFAPKEMASKMGQLSLTWFSSRDDPLRELLQNV